MTEYLKCVRCGRETDERYSYTRPHKRVEHLDSDCKGESYGVFYEEV